MAEPTREEVRHLMEESESPRQWEDNCDIVKLAFGGDYPEWWYEEILASGLAKRVLAQWGLSDGLRVVILQKDSKEGEGKEREQ